MSDARAPWRLSELSAEEIARLPIAELHARALAAAVLVLGAARVRELVPDVAPDVQKRVDALVSGAH